MIGHVVTRYQITLEVNDQPGVLATVAGILAEGGVSVATVVQNAGEETDPTARLIIGTHRATEQALSDTVGELAASAVVDRVVSVLRVEGE